MTRIVVEEDYRSTGIDDHESLDHAPKDRIDFLLFHEDLFDLLPDFHAHLVQILLQEREFILALAREKILGEGAQGDLLGKVCHAPDPLAEPAGKKIGEDQTHGRDEHKADQDGPAHGAYDLFDVPEGNRKAKDARARPCAVDDSLVKHLVSDRGAITDAFSGSTRQRLEHFRAGPVIFHRRGGLLRVSQDLSIGGDDRQAYAQVRGDKPAQLVKGFPFELRGEQPAYDLGLLLELFL